MGRPSAVADFGVWLLALAAAAGLVLSLVNYFMDEGIGYSAGALLVVVSTFLVLVAALLLALEMVGARWLRIVFDVLLFLGIVGTGLAAWFLDAGPLIAFMIAALIGWLAYVLAGSGPGARPLAVQPAEAAS
jgi:hypothetical protein